MKRFPGARAAYETIDFDSYKMGEGKLENSIHGSSILNCLTNDKYYFFLFVFIVAAYKELIMPKIAERTNKVSIPKVCQI